MREDWSLDEEELKNETDREYSLIDEGQFIKEQMEYINKETDSARFWASEHCHKILKDGLIPRVCEMGQGLGHWLASLPHDCEKWGVDFSKIACEKAHRLYPNLKLVQASVCSELNLKPMDIIIDGHVLYFLFSKKQRDFYFGQIKKSLKHDGVFYGECPVLTSPYPFLQYSITSSVYLFNQKPLKWIPSSLILEQELKEHFEIKRFKIDSHKKMAIHPKWPNFTHDLAQFILTCHQNDSSHLD